MHRESPLSSPTFSRRDFLGLVGLGAVGVSNAVRGEEPGFKPISETQQKTKSIIRRILAKNGKWDRIETENFRVHHQGHAAIQDLASLLEDTKSQIQQVFLGKTVPWERLADIYAYPTKESYEKAASVPFQAPAHMVARYDRGTKVVESRRMDINLQHPEALQSLLPHELTHLFLVDQCGHHYVPRWADEGIAITAEPQAKIDWAVSLLQVDTKLHSLRDLFAMKEYPATRPEMNMFYGQSVSLVMKMCAQGKQRTFLQFLRDALDTDYDKALKKHYSYSTVEDLEGDWLKKTFPHGRAANQMPLPISK